MADFISNSVGECVLVDKDYYSEDGKSLESALHLAVKPKSGESFRQWLSRADNAQSSSTYVLDLSKDPKYKKKAPYVKYSYDHHAGTDYQIIDKEEYDKSVSGMKNRNNLSQSQLFG